MCIRDRKESVKTLILTLWKRDDEPPTRAEEVALSNAVNLFLEKIRRDSSIKPVSYTHLDVYKRQVIDLPVPVVDEGRAVNASFPVLPEHHV